MSQWTDEGLLRLVDLIYDGMRNRGEVIDLVKLAAWVERPRRTETYQRHGLMVWLVVNEGRTVNETAMEVGRSTQRVYQVLRKEVRQLRMPINRVRYATGVPDEERLRALLDDVR